jgi:hypothetical protein
MNIIERFSKNLKNIEYPKEKCSWNIAGILKGKNAFYKYDVRDMFKMSNGELGKRGKTNSKADKMVFEAEEEWLILDVEELASYIKKKQLKVVQLEDLISELDWNIILPKY